MPNQVNVYSRKVLTSTKNQPCTSAPQEGPLALELKERSKIKSNPAGKPGFKHIWFPLTGDCKTPQRQKTFLPPCLKSLASSKMVDPEEGPESQN